MLNISSDVIRGYNDTIILYLLLDRPSYGYEISKQIRLISEEKYVIKETTLYSAFTRLEKNGYITSFSSSDNASGKRRTYYQITDAGREYYRMKCEEWKLTIKNYLENMFSHLPNTPEVQKAKYELYQMMEDKYNELISEGKSDNEAIGIVISEFGNLDELADSLGIKSFVDPSQAMPAANTLSHETAAAFLRDSAKHAYLTAFGVLLCIVASLGPIFCEYIPFTHASDDIADAIGVTILFLCIAVAVGFFIFSGSISSKWSYLKQKPYCIDFETANWVIERKESYRSTHAMLLTVGIMLCILCAVPAIIISSLNTKSTFADSLSGGLVLVFIAIGVFMIVFTNMKKSSFDKLLSLNGAQTMGGNFANSHDGKVHYENPVVAAIMSVYWSTVTCIYLCWSFITFDWGITWIIWPIAAIINSLVENLLGDKHRN